MPKTIIYIRHGHDKKSHYKFDEKLVDEGKEKARQLAKKLVREYGIPDVIYLSPMRRTRQTGDEFLKVVNKYRQTHGHKTTKGESRKTETRKNETRLETEPRIGRLFTHAQQREHDAHRKNRKRYLRHSTKNVIMDKDKEAFGERVAKQFQQISETGEDQVIWNITHSLVLLHVAKMNNIERDRHVKYLDTLVIDKKQ